ncbi:hypothetical protein BDC45DRAFT_48672 [Circinella umbellata]|nr:hypothetical protein BDC45DRAFT_48672 [Circinella umbellata]
MVQPQRGVNFTFPYEDDQLDVLNTITIVVASISLFASILVLIFYGLFMYYERKKADRVSLRCVALGSISNVIDITLDLGSTIGETPQTGCRVIGLIVNFMDVLNAGFLAVIGINLFLVFVLKIDRTKRLERIYYPLIVFYGIMAMIGPIVKESQQFVPKNPTFNCW